jgi:thioredoxin 1
MRLCLPMLALVVASLGCGESDPPGRPIPAAVAPADPAPNAASIPREDNVAADAGAAPAPRAPLPIGKPMLVEFSRDSCLPCKLMEPWLEELKKRHAGAVEIVEVDLDEPGNGGLARFFKARSVPLQVYVAADGREAARNVGLATLPQMQQQLERLGFLAPR